MIFDRFTLRLLRFRAGARLGFTSTSPAIPSGGSRLHDSQSAPPCRLSFVPSGRHLDTSAERLPVLSFPFASTPPLEWVVLADRFTAAYYASVLHRLLSSDDHARTINFFSFSTRTLLTHTRAHRMLCNVRVCEVFYQHI